MTANKHYKLVVVTVTYIPDAVELSLFIASFFKYNDLADEARLIVVDNSPENSWDIESFKRKYLSVDFVLNPSNPGFGASNNKGFNLYSSDYTLFINNDVEFLEPLFIPLINTMESDDKIGCIGIHQEGGAPSFFQKMTAPKNVQLDKFDDKVHFVSGAFMFFRSSYFKEIGEFDPNIFMYLEEFDLSERLIKHGYKTVFINKYKFLHKVGNRKRVNDTIWIKSIPSFRYVCEKYGLDPKEKTNGLMHRLRLLLVYNLLRLDFKQMRKVLNIYRAEKRLIYNK